MEYTNKDVIQKPQKIKAIITKIDTKNSNEIFGSSNNERIENKEYFVISVENNNHSINKEYKFAKYDAGKVPETSYLGRFLLKYNELKIGMTIFLIKNKNNFYDIET